MGMATWWVVFFELPRDPIWPADSKSRGAGGGQSWVPRQPDERGDKQAGPHRQKIPQPYCLKLCQFNRIGFGSNWNSDRFGFGLTSRGTWEHRGCLRTCRMAGVGGLTARARVGSYVCLAVVALVRLAVHVPATCCRGERKITATCHGEAGLKEVVMPRARHMGKTVIVDIAVLCRGLRKCSRLLSLGTRGTASQRSWGAQLIITTPDMMPGFESTGFKAKGGGETMREERKKKVGPGAGVGVGRDKWGGVVLGVEVSVHVTRPIPRCRLSPLASARMNDWNNWRKAAVAATKEGHLPLSLNCGTVTVPRKSPSLLSSPPPPRLPSQFLTFLNLYWIPFNHLRLGVSIYEKRFLRTALKSCDGWLGIECCGDSLLPSIAINRHGSVPCMAIMVASAAATVTMPQLLPPCLLRVCLLGLLHAKYHCNLAGESEVKKKDTEDWKPMTERGQRSKPAKATGSGERERERVRVRVQDTDYLMASPLPPSFPIAVPSLL
ncbi:hypothetical protein MUK42_12212 [Musa troglodytarum]|uniref:Uncharacterized protein n=1 Tax=Musa troglodytarum TaxID=320322 RepID=A0A9E7JL07_9LILI|nr:hypothetical protein MUK42_12212 [Musa troglodytarum]